MKVIIRGIADIPADAVHYLLCEFEKLDYVAYTEADRDNLLIKTIPDENMHPSSFVNIGGMLCIFLITADMLGNENRDKVEIAFDDNTILDIFED